MSGSVFVSGKWSLGLVWVGLLCGRIGAVAAAILVCVSEHGTGSTDETLERLGCEATGTDPVEPWEEELTDAAFAGTEAGIFIFRVHFGQEKTVPA